MTIYPARAGAFPAASFQTVQDSLDYVRFVQDSHPVCGVCSCPAKSYPIHYPGTLPSLLNLESPCERFPFPTDAKLDI